jgi:hypothetical protein
MKTLQFKEPIDTGKGYLKVDVEVGRVEIRTHEAQHVAVLAEFRGAEITVTREMDAVVVRAGVERGLGRWLPGRNSKVHLTIDVPAACRVDARVVTGMLDIQDVLGPVPSHVTTGKTTLANLGQAVDARNTTGSIEYDGVLVDEEHRFYTTTGHLRLRLHKIPNAWLDAKTVTGHISISGDFPLEKAKQSRTVVGRKVRGMLGSGTGEIRARVVTGHIQLEQV